MLRYIVNRLLTVIPTLFVVSVVVFGLQQMLPGDAAIALAGESLGRPNRMRSPKVACGRKTVR